MKITMKSLRAEHRNNFTHVETISVPRGKDGFVEIKTRVKRGGYVSFKPWARSLKLTGEFCPKLKKILS